MERDGSETGETAFSASQGELVMPSKALAASNVQVVHPRGNQEVCLC